MLLIYIPFHKNSLIEVDLVTLDDLLYFQVILILINQSTPNQRQEKNFCINYSRKHFIRAWQFKQKYMD